MLPHRIPENRRITKEWSLDQIREIQMRRYILRKSALEVFLLDGSSIFLNFPEGGQEEISQKLIRQRKSKCPNFRYYKTLDPRKMIEKSGLLKKWLSHEISNFEYLMQLNALSGRSYKDCTQYPVFPWILSDYSSAAINLQDPFFYRDLERPMG